MTIGIRPEHIVISDGSDNTLQAEVAYIEHLGESSFLYTQIQGIEDPVVVRQEGDTLAKMGDCLTLSLAVQHCHLFDEKGRACK